MKGGFECVDSSSREAYGDEDADVWNGVLGVEVMGSEEVRSK